MHEWRAVEELLLLDGRAKLAPADYLKQEKYSVHHMVSIQVKI